MKVIPAASGVVAADHARQKQARADLRQAAEARKALVAAEASKLRSSPRFQASETRKSQARAKLQQIRDWLKIVKKLYAQNPKGMAKALAQAFKDLKAAVQAYKDAGGQEMGLAGGAAFMPLPAAAAGETSSTEREPRQERPPAEPAAQGPGLYNAIAGEVRKQVGEDGLQFVREVRALVDDVVLLLDTARGQASIRRKDKATERAFEEADTELKELRDLMSLTEREIRNAAPAAGMTLSVAA